MTGRVLITGTSGQVGGALLGLLRHRFPDADVFAPGREEMDLGDAESVRRYVRRVGPEWIVSSGAFTAVDAAETDRGTAFAVNAAAPAVMAEEAAQSGAVMIHLSTDYVFPGTGIAPWVETDPTGPLNVYGESKLAGERAIAASGAAHVILRTSWVYSAAGKNFVKTMLHLLRTRDTPLRVVADQHGAPTSAADLAEAIAAIMAWVEDRATGRGRAEVAGEVSGVYHCAGSGETTWAGLAGAVRQFVLEEGLATPPEIVSVASSEYPTPAARPRNSRMDCGKLERTFGIRLPQWERSVGTVLRQMYFEAGRN